MMLRQGVRAAFAAGVFLTPLTASAQCVDSFNLGLGGVEFQPLQQVFPLGTGTGLAALVSTITTVNTAFLGSNSAIASVRGGTSGDRIGGGGWARTVVGSSETKTHSTGILENTATLTGSNGQPFEGKQTCQTTTQQEYYGVQFGQDIYVANIAGGGSSFHFGITGGYLRVDSRDRTPAGEYANPNIPIGFYGVAFYDGTFSTPAGAFRQSADVPFVGAYTAYTSGKFFVDALMRLDLYNNRLSDPLNGLSDTPLAATGYSVGATTGYSIDLGKGWFAEPGLGLLASRVSVSSLDVPGVVGTGPFTDAPARGTVTVSEIDSLMGRASLTVGANYTLGSVALQSYVTASAIREFAGPVSATSSLPSDHGLAASPLSSRVDRIGTYGQTSLGTAYVFGNTGWLGYVKGDYKFGENIEAISGTTGLRFQF